MLPAQYATVTGMPEARLVSEPWQMYSAYRPTLSRNTIRSSLLISPRQVTSSVSVASVALTLLAEMTSGMSPSGLPQRSKIVNRMMAS